MRSRFIKVGVGIVILLATLVWLGMAGFDEGKSYYMTADEVVALGSAASSRQIMLMGNLVPGTIAHVDGRLNFSVRYNDVTVPVVYEGSAPVPDTFRDGQEIQTLVEGRMGASGRFVGQKIQAKCASKYEADPSAAYSQPAASTATTTGAPSRPSY